MLGCGFVVGSVREPMGSNYSVYTIFSMYYVILVSDQ